MNQVARFYSPWCKNDRWLSRTRSSSLRRARCPCSPLFSSSNATPSTFLPTTVRLLSSTGFFQPSEIVCRARLPVVRVPRVLFIFHWCQTPMSRTPERAVSNEIRFVPIRWQPQLSTLLVQIKSRGTAARTYDLRGISPSITEEPTPVTFARGFNKSNRCLVDAPLTKLPKHRSNAIAKTLSSLFHCEQNQIGKGRSLAEDLSWDPPTRKIGSRGGRTRNKSSRKIGATRGGFPSKRTTHLRHDSSGWTMLVFVYSSDSIYGTASAAAQKIADRCQIFRQCSEDGLLIYQTATKIGRANRRRSRLTWATRLALSPCSTLSHR